MTKMHIDDIESPDVAVYLDSLRRPWWAIARSTQPQLHLQRVGCRLHPLDMPRLSVIPSSPWAQDTWERVELTETAVQKALQDNGGRF